MLLNYRSLACHCSFRTERKSLILFLLLFFSLEWFRARLIKKFE